MFLLLSAILRVQKSRDTIRSGKKKPEKKVLRFSNFYIHQRWIQGNESVRFLWNVRNIISNYVHICREESAQDDCLMYDSFI